MRVHYDNDVDAIIYQIREPETWRSIWRLQKVLI